MFLVKYCPCSSRLRGSVDSLSPILRPWGGCNSQRSVIESVDMGVLYPLEVGLGCGVEGVALVVAAYVCVRLHQSRRATPRDTATLLLACLGHLCRIGWVVARRYIDDTHFDFAINRISMAALLLSFSLYCNRCFLVSSKYSSRRPLSFHIVTWTSAAVVGGVLAIIVWYSFQEPDEREGHPFYEFNTIFMALAGVFISLLFALGGLHMIRELRQAMSFKASPEMHNLSLHVGIASSVGAVCSLCRAFGFAHRPLTGNYLPRPLYIPLCYVLPDCIPSLTISVLLRGWGLERKKLPRKVQVQV
ncbi:hypothetical protein KIPB_005071 [Kipferlia bialata]|uniref:THH1/TOM1/TOM3 domain-containing protein n=1 Tax=Kipferlia bialata TaxID=797122 RepID=A0A9K3GHW7_9EUKA|nr:hypothetical protein KIPB_005071 [Kipferlia bialata]|eukprot:g5071.t1